MTTARKSWPGRAVVVFAIGLTAMASASLAAHRRDEYLQAARITIEPSRVRIDLDLTPGIALAHDIVAGIDRDGDGVVGADEAQAYATRVLGDLRLDVDGAPV